MANRIVIAALLVLLPNTGHAQTCMGSASFEERFLQSGVDVSSSTGSQSVTVGLSAGASTGPFASAGVGTAHNGSLGDYSPVYAATAGASFSLRAQPSVHFCPFLSALALRDVDFPNGRKVNSEAFGIGGSVGASFRSNPGFAAVPYASVAAVIEDATIYTQPYAPDFGQTFASSDNYGTVSFGVGLLFGSSVTVRPSMSLGIGHGNTSHSYGVRVAFSFGHLPQHATVVREGGSLVNVWINPRAGVYYCPGSKWFGNTAEGSFTSERDAIAAGFAAELGKLCEAKDANPATPPGD